MNVQTTSDKVVRKHAHPPNTEQPCRQRRAVETALGVLRRASFALLIAAVPQLAVNVFTA